MAVPIMYIVFTIVFVFVVFVVSLLLFCSFVVSFVHLLFNYIYIALRFGKVEINNFCCLV